MNRVEELAKKKGYTMAQIAAAWVMNKDRTSVRIVSFQRVLITVPTLPRCVGSDIRNDKIEELGGNHR